jgi:hypothetical protein
MPFFSPPHQSHHPGLRVTEDPAHHGVGTKLPKPVLVFQSPLLAHREIVPGFRTGANPRLPLWHKCFRAIMTSKSPTHFGEDPFLIDHPYNQVQASDAPLPKNLVRVGSWDEIYRYLA